MKVIFTVHGTWLQRNPFSELKKSQKRKSSPLKLALAAALQKKKGMKGWRNKMAKESFRTRNSAFAWFAVAEHTSAIVLMLSQAVGLPNMAPLTPGSRPLICTRKSLILR